MDEANHVVVRFNDGKLLKGATRDFNPGRPDFHVLPAGGGPAVKVQGKDLKAVFFVKSLEGNPGHAEIREFLAAPAARAHGKKIAVLFKDDELLCGYTLSYQPGRPGFFVFPVDPQSNNIRVYVLSASAAEVQAGPAAEVLARKVQERQADQQARG